MGLWLGNAWGSVVTYSNFPGAVPSTSYTVTVNGQAVFAEKFKDISYARFAFSVVANVSITASQAIASFGVSPQSYGVAASVSGNSIAFALCQPARLVVTVNSMEKLFIFADPLEANPPVLGAPGVTNVMSYVTDNTGATLQTSQIQSALGAASASQDGGVLYFPDGKYLSGSLHLPSNTTIYLASGALLQGSSNASDYSSSGYGFILIQSASNVKITGRGAIDGNGTALRAAGAPHFELVRPTGVNNLDIEDVLLRDAAGFTVHIIDSSNVTCSHYKVMNDVSQVNLDGTDPDSSDHVTVDGIFEYTSDDGAAVKTAGSRATDSILVENSVFWTLKNAMKVGSPTSSALYNFSNVTFQNNDAVQTEHALALYLGGTTNSSATIQGVTFANNRSETISGAASPNLIQFIVSNPGGAISNVSVTDFTASTQGPSASNIQGYDATHTISNVTFDNLYVAGGLQLDAVDAGINTSFVNGLTFSSGARAPLPLNCEADGGVSAQDGGTSSGDGGSTAVRNPHGPGCHCGSVEPGACAAFALLAMLKRRRGAASRSS